MAKDYKIIRRFRGYFTKIDKTAAPVGVLVSPSQNVLINDEEKIATRAGYTRDGAANDSINPVESHYDWKTQRGAERNLRGYDDELEVRFVNAAGTISWNRLTDSWSDVDFVFTKWWDTTEDLELLLFVVGDSNIYEWSGGMAEISSVTSNTITKKGTPTWSQEGFYTARNRSIIIRGVTYAYTGGETTTALTGVTPDPTAQGANEPVDGDVVVQATVTNSNQPASNLENDFIKTLDNQVFVGSVITNEIFVSTNTSFTTYTFSSPRVPGDGALLALDSKGKGLAVLQRNMIIFAGEDDVYKTNFEQLDVGGILSETLNVKKLKTGTKQGAFSHDLIMEFGIGLAYISNEPALRILESAEDLENPILKSWSNNIKPDFDAETFTDGNIRFHRNRIYISAPANAKVYILEMKEVVNQDTGEVQLKIFWQTPQILPFRRLATIGADLYGHSAQVPETYKAFDDTDDNGNAFTARAAFAYRNFGKRALLKDFDEYFNEGYISANTQLTARINYEFEGSEQQLEHIIDGSDSQIIFESLISAAFGDNPMGDAPMGFFPAETSQLPKFRRIIELPPIPFHEYQMVFETTGQDEQWEILAQGPAARLSKLQPTSIKK